MSHSFDAGTPHRLKLDRAAQKSKSWRREVTTTMDGEKMTQSSFAAPADGLFDFDAVRRWQQNAFRSARILQVSTQNT